MVFTVLKIICLVLLALLGIFCALTIILLFAPFRYRAKSRGKVSDPNKLPVYARLTWLFYFVRLYYTRTDGKADFYIKILFFRLKKRKSPENSGVEEYERADSDSNSNENSEGNSVEETLEKRPHSEEKEKRYDYDLTEENQSIFDRIKDILNSIKQIRDYPDKKEIADATFLLMKRIFSAIKPRRLSLRGEVGFEDPAVTGYFFAALSFMNALTGLDINLNGNYEQKKADVDLFAKGSFTLWSILWPIVLYILKRPIWRIVKKILFKKGDMDE